MTAALGRLRNAILLPLILGSLFGQPFQPCSEDRAAEMKRRVIETLNLRPGDTAADVGCGDGFYTIPWLALSAHQASCTPKISVTRRLSSSRSIWQKKDC